MSENAVPQEFPFGTLDFTGIKVIGLSGGGIQKINGDATPLQTITGDIQTVIADLGAGAHNISHHAVLQVVFTPAGLPINVPPGVLTPLLSDFIAQPGLYFCSVNINQTAPILGSINALLEILNGGSVIGTHAWETILTANVATFSGFCVSYCINCVGGENFTCQLTQDSGAPLNVNVVQNIMRLGTFP